MTASKAISLYNQSLDYLQGDGVAKDEQRAFALNAEAAQSGYADAVLAHGVSGSDQSYALHPRILGEKPVANWALQRLFDGQIRPQERSATPWKNDAPIGRDFGPKNWL